VTGSPNRFTTISGYSHLFLLLSGYAIFEQPDDAYHRSGRNSQRSLRRATGGGAEAAIDKWWTWVWVMRSHRRRHTAMARS